MERPFAPDLGAALFAGAGPCPPRGARGGGPMAADGDGRLYVATSDGGIAAADMREYLLGDEVRVVDAGKESGGNRARATTLPPSPPILQPPVPPPPIRRLALDPPLDFDVAHFAISPDGARAALAGPSRSDADTHAARVAAVAAGGAGPTPSAPLAAPLFAARPGLRVLQLAWHPASARHVFLLTSDSVLRLYDVADAATPEQQFDLAGLRSGGSSSGLGLRDPGAGGRRAAAFACGPPAGWDALTVYIAADDGSIFTLCPVAPFGAALPAADAAALAAASAPGEPRAWAQRALPPPGPGDEHGLVRVRPHALDEHAPALAGPLPVGAGGGASARVVAAGDAAVGLACLARAPGALALVVATAGGRLVALAVAGAAAPAFAAAPPRVAPGPRGGVAAVRSVCRAAPPVTGRRGLLLDAVELGGEGGRGGAGGGAPTPSPSHLPLLSPDPDDPARLYVTRGADAFALDVDWLPALAARLAGGGGGAGLPRARARSLRLGPRAEPSSIPIAVAPLAAPPADGGLVLLLGGGRAALARAARAAGAAAAAGSPRRLPEAATQPPSPALAKVLAEAPAKVALPPSSGDAADGSTTAGAAALAFATRALTATHVHYAHTAAAAMAGAGADLRAAAASTTAAARGVADRARGAASARAAARERLEKAVKLQANLEARIRLLAKLHWSLPRPASAAERALAARELPALEAAAASLATDILSLARRVAALHLAPAAPPRAAPAPPAAQLARARAVAAAAAAATAAASRQAAALDAAVRDAEEDALCV
jgi:hypothetical protein